MSAGGRDAKRVIGLSGTVVRGPFGGGSKSARQAYWLETASGRFVLRRKDADGLSDDALAPFVGKRVVCDGFELGYQFLAERIEQTD